MYQLTSSIPYLLNRLGVRMGALFSRKIEASGLTLPMYRVLASLAEQPGQKLSDLAAMTSAELSTMSRLIGAMVGMGLTTRERMPGNERTVQINLTPKGQALAKDLMHEAQHYEEVAISQLRAADVVKLKVLLGQIYESLDTLEAELVAPASQAG